MSFRSSRAAGVPTGVWLLSTRDRYAALVKSCELSNDGRVRSKSILALNRSNDGLGGRSKLGRVMGDSNPPAIIGGREKSIGL
jgi:hypothetical protein